MKGTLPPPACVAQDFSSTCISWRVEGGGNLWSCNPEAHKQAAQGNTTPSWSAQSYSTQNKGANPQTRMTLRKRRIMCENGAGRLLSSGQSEASGSCRKDCGLTPAARVEPAAEPKKASPRLNSSFKSHLEQPVRAARCEFWLLRAQAQAPAQTGGSALL